TTSRTTRCCSISGSCCRRLKWSSWARVPADYAVSVMNSDKERRRLLILENDRALRRELESIFADLEVTISEASEQTLALVRRLEPDVVLFDIGPALDPSAATPALELLRQILNIAP